MVQLAKVNRNEDFSPTLSSSLIDRLENDSFGLTPKLLGHLYFVFRDIIFLTDK